MVRRRTVAVFALYVRKYVCGRSVDIATLFAESDGMAGQAHRVRPLSDGFQRCQRSGVERLAPFIVNGGMTLSTGRLSRKLTRHTGVAGAAVTSAPSTASGLHGASGCQQEQARNAGYTNRYDRNPF